MIELRPYQQDLYVKIHQKLFDEDVKKVCAALPTGGGKSVLIAKIAQELPGRTLILTHRIEILKQNSEWLGDAAILTSKENTLRYDCKIVIAMVQTTFARIKKYGTEYLGEFDNIILDEVQVLIFQKVFEKYDFKRLVGFTGTPVLNKKKYSSIDGVEYVEPFTLSEIFDDLVQGTDTQDLIDLGYLVQDYNIVLNLPDFDKLRESDSAPDGYTTKSLDDVYSNTASLRILNEAYFEHCKGKKTLIFNASTKINLMVYEHFKEQELNVKMFDTVNTTDINPDTEKPYSRDEIIEWFNDERDAILINTNVFTTGFNVTDVEVVIVNRATKSLSLWVQMVGRGSRTTTKIFKDLFTVIDLGQNIHEHGMWSAKRDWMDYFYSSGRKRKNKSDVLDTWECSNCGAYNVIGELICMVCGAPKTDAIVKKGRLKKKKDGKLEVLREMPLPKAFSIIDYTKNKEETANFAFLLLERKIVDLFRHYNVTKDFYLKNESAFNKRVKDIYRPIYFAIIKSDLKGSRKRLDTQFKRVLDKIKKMYNLKKETVG